MQNETRQMPGDAPRDYPGSLPRRDDSLSRFLGGSPLAVAFRLVLLSILVGVVDRKSTRLNSSHITPSRMPSSA